MSNKSMIYPTPEVILKMREFVKDEDNLEDVYWNINQEDLNDLSDDQKRVAAQTICEEFERDLLKKGMKFTSCSGTGACPTRTVDDKEISEEQTNKLKELGFSIEENCGDDGVYVFLPDDSTEFEIALELDYHFMSPTDHMGQDLAIKCTKFPEVYIYLATWATWDCVDELRMAYDFGTDLLKLYNEIFS